MCKSLRIVGILRKSAQIPRGPGCAGVCSRKYERVFARVLEVTLLLQLSIAGVAPERLGKWKPGGLYTSEDVSEVPVPFVGAFAACHISFSWCRRAWQRLRRVTGTTCSNCKQLFGHITSLPPFPSFPSLLVFTMVHLSL